MAEPKEQAGLAGALEPQPDFSAPPPQTPQEFAQRKSAWGQVMQKVESDPNIMRAIAIAGIRMMQPGATFGQGIASGYGAYEAGNAAMDAMTRQAQLDQQRAAMQDAQMGEIRQRTVESAEMAPERRRGLELGNRAKDLDIAMTEDQAQLRRDLLAAQVDATKATAADRRANAAASPRGSEQVTQFDRVFETLLAEEQLKNPTANPAIQRANAMRAALTGRYAAPAETKLDEGQAKAVALYLRYKDAPDTKRIVDNVDASQFAYGEQLAKQQGLVPTGSNDSGIQPIGGGAAPKAVVRRTPIVDKDGNITGFK